MTEELLRDKHIIWQCVSCNKCTYACPRDVSPESVMKALGHWLELKGHVPKPASAHFDEVFAEQVFATGRIEEGRIIRRFFRRMRLPLAQDWLVEMARRLVRHLPVKMLMAMGLAGAVRPRTRGWGAARAAIADYVAERRAADRRALGLAE
jgi:heterodisulfide reductase subunit C